MGLQNACHVSKVRVCVSETMTGELFLVGWGGGILHPRFLQRDAPRQDLLAKSYSRKPWGRPKQILMWADEPAQPLSANSAGEPLIWCIKCNIRVVPWQDEIRLRPFFAPVSHVSPVALPCLTFWYQLHGPNIAPFSSLMLWSAAKTRRLTRTCLDFSWFAHFGRQASVPVDQPCRSSGCKSLRHAWHAEGNGRQQDATGCNQQSQVECIDYSV